MAENLPCSAEQLMYWLQDSLRDRFPGWSVVRHANRVDDEAVDVESPVDLDDLASVYLVSPDSDKMLFIDISIGDTIEELIGKDVWIE